MHNEVYSQLLLYELNVAECLYIALLGMLLNVSALQECDNGCRIENLLHRQKHIHETKVCPKRPGADDCFCMFCNAHCTKSTIDKHYAETCPHRYVQCESCGKKDIRCTDLSDHHAHQCPMRLVVCTLGCGTSLFANMLKDHATCCPCRIVQCQLECGIKDLKAKDRIEHEQSHFSGMRPVEGSSRLGYAGPRRSSLGLNPQKQGAAGPRNQALSEDQRKNLCRFTRQDRSMCENSRHDH